MLSTGCAYPHRSFSCSDSFYTQNNLLSFSHHLFTPRLVFNKYYLLMSIVTRPFPRLPQPSYVKAWVVTTFHHIQIAEYLRDV